MANKMFAGEGAGAFIADVQAILGLILLTVLTLIAVVGGVIVMLAATLYHFPRLSQAVLILAWVTWVLVSTIPLRCFQFIGSSLELAQAPRPVYVALRQKERNLLVRIIMAAWWLANSIAAVALVHALIPNISGTSRTNASENVDLSWSGDIGSDDGRLCIEQLPALRHRLHSKKRAVGDDDLAKSDRN